MKGNCAINPYYLWFCEIECCLFAKFFLILLCIPNRCVDILESVFAVLNRKCGSFQKQKDNEQHSFLVYVWVYWHILCQCLTHYRCGALYRLFLLRFYHNLLFNKRNHLHTFFFYKSLLGGGRVNITTMKPINHTIQESDTYIEYLKTQSVDFFVEVKRGTRFSIISVCENNTNIFLLKSIVGGHIFYPTCNKETIEGLWRTLETENN